MWLLFLALSAVPDEYPELPSLSELSRFPTPAVVQTQRGMWARHEEWLRAEMRHFWPVMWPAEKERAEWLIYHCQRNEIFWEKLWTVHNYSDPDYNDGEGESRRHLYGLMVSMTEEEWGRGWHPPLLRPEMVPPAPRPEKAGSGATP